MEFIKEEIKVEMGITDDSDLDKAVIRELTKGDEESTEKIKLLYQVLLTSNSMALTLNSKK